jgi:hypothetical protein
MNEIDPRLAFLERASARLILVEACLMSLDEAFFGLLDGLQCTCGDAHERQPRHQAGRAA